MKLSEFLKIHLDIDASNIPSSIDDLDIQTDLKDYTDNYFVKSATEEKLASRYYQISDGMIVGEVKPSRDELTTFIKNELIESKDLLSILLHQIGELTSEPNTQNISLYHLIVRNFKDLFMGFLKYPEQARIIKLGYKLSREFEVGRSSYYMLRNGIVPSGLNQRGWKFHLSIRDTKLDGINKLNLIKAWNSIVGCFFEYQVSRVKVFTNDTIQDDNNNDPYQVGKQITIYGNQFSSDINRCKQFLTRLTKLLVASKINPGYRPAGNKSINGSEYISYRFDTYPPGHEYAGKRREGDAHKPESAYDPFHLIKLNYRQRKSMGRKQVLEEPIELKETLPFIPSIPVQEVRFIM